MRRSATSMPAVITMDGEIKMSTYAGIARHDRSMLVRSLLLVALARS